MIVGGSPESVEYQVELLDLSNSTSGCPSVPDCPLNGRGSVGTFIGDMALVCGGRSNQEYFAACYMFDQMVIWAVRGDKIFFN